MALKNFRPALRDCAAAATLQSSAPSAKTLLRLARCHFALGDVESASIVLRQLSDLEPSNAAAAQLKRQVEGVQMHLDRARQALERGEWIHASQGLTHAEKEVTELPAAWRLLRAEIQLRKGDLDAANISASEVLRRDQADPEALVMRARILTARGNEMEKAVKHAQAALRSDPEHKQARKVLKLARKLEAKKTEANEAYKNGSVEEAVKL